MSCAVALYDQERAAPRLRPQVRRTLPQPERMFQQCLVRFALDL
jgi:hypothetical protein